MNRTENPFGASGPAAYPAGAAKSKAAKIAHCDWDRASRFRMEVPPGGGRREVREIGRLAGA